MTPGSPDATREEQRDEAAPCDERGEDGQLSKGGVGQHTLRSGRCDGDGLATRLDESVEQRDVKRPSNPRGMCP
jgi:hypothetical protein